MEEMTNKKLEEINKFPFKKQQQENQEKNNQTGETNSPNSLEN